MIITVYRTTFSRWDFSQKMSIVNIPLDSEYTSEVSTFVYFSNSFYILVQRPPFWCWRNVYCVASLNYGGSGRNDLGPTYWSFKQLPDSISICDVNRAIICCCYIYLFYCCLIVCLIFLFYHFFLFVLYIISVNMADFNLDIIVIIILVSFWKP